MFDADGDQGRGQGPFPGLTSLTHWPVRTRCGRVRRALHCSIEVIPSNATLPAKALQLCSWLESPQICTVSPACHKLPSQNPSLRLETDLVRLVAARHLSATDPGPRLCWTQRLKRCPDPRDRKREWPSLVVAGSTPKLHRLNLQAPRFCSWCRGQCVFCSHWARTSGQTAYRCYSIYNKTQTFSKREQISSSTQHEWPVPTWRQTP